MKYVCLNIIIRYHFLNFNIQKKILSVYNKLIQRLPWCSVVKNQSDSSGDTDSIPDPGGRPLLLLSSCQSCSTLIPWTVACQTPLSSTVSGSLLKLISIESMMLSSYLILCHPFSSCPLSFLASRSFPVNRLLPSGAQSIDASASASVLPMNILG